MAFTAKKSPSIDTSGNIQKLIDSTVNLSKYCDDEFAQVASSLQDFFQLKVSYVAPTKPRQGMVVYADGTHWNPGAGEGAYVYGSDAAWHWLEAPDESSVIAAMQSAWTAYTPTVTPSTGAFTSTTPVGRYKQIGKTIHIQIQIKIVTVGTAAGFVQASLPVNNNSAIGNQMISGRENFNTGKSIWGIISSNLCIIGNYDNSSPIAAGNLVNVGGTYEAA